VQKYCEKCYYELEERHHKDKETHAAVATALELESITSGGSADKKEEE
jgi:hypothetical protein